jgi:hypothetical protein
MVSRRITAFLLAALLLAVPAVAAAAPAASTASPGHAASWSGAIAQVRAFLASLLPSFATAGVSHRDGAAAPAGSRRPGRTTLNGGGTPCYSSGMDPNGNCGPG